MRRVETVRGSVSATSHNFWRQLEESQDLPRGSLAPAHPLWLVVDANAAVEDVLWMAERREMAAQTGLRDALSSGCIVGFAPTTIQDEVPASLRRIARERGARIEGGRGRRRTSPSIERLMGEWATLQNQLVILAVPPNMAFRAIVDTKDVPYVALYRDLGADGVLGKDKHIRQMDGREVAREEVMKWNAYGQRATQVYPVRQATAFTGSLGILAVVETVKVGANVWRRLPPAFKIALVVCVVGGLWYMSQRPATMPRGVARPPRPKIGDAILGLVDKHVKAGAAMDELRERIALTAQPRSLRSGAIAVLAMEDGPLAFPELLRRMLAVGCVPAEVGDGSQVASLLPSVPDFEVTADGKWALSPGRGGSIRSV